MLIKEYLECSTKLQVTRLLKGEDKYFTRPISVRDRGQDI